MVDTAKARRAKRPKKAVDLAELRRKAALYNVGSSTQCPKTQCKKQKPRAPPSPTGRPPMSTVGFVHDLQSTVPTPPKQRGTSMAAGWRLGHSNSASSFKFAGQGIDGLLEPSAGARQVLATSLTDEFKGLLLAYPPPKARFDTISPAPNMHCQVMDVALEISEPRDWTKRIEALPSKCNFNPNLPRAWKIQEPHEDIYEPGTKPDWVPPASPPHTHYFQTDLERRENNTPHMSPAKQSRNAVPLRRGPATPVPKYELPDQTTQHFIQHAQAAERVYLEVEAKAGALKKPGQMYSLPIAKSGRACRLGLETLHSDVSATLEKRKLRPKSALHVGSISKPMVTVAGAKVRPKTARLSFLRSATVYCMDTAERNTVEEYAEKMQMEKEKRKSVVGQKGGILGRNKTIVQRSISFIFNCLRNQSFANVPMHLRPLYEALDVEDYMKHGASDRRGNRALLEVQSQSYDAAFDSESLPLLWLDRKQFTVALQQLKFSTNDINLLFNAFDFDLEHKVEVYDYVSLKLTIEEVGEVCREIRTLQLAKQREIMPSLLLSGNKSRFRESI
ncbi:hypothetical protein ACHHYP_12009 [Achlya hypogyna]|uniref:EF-hand domain-containing protein n=1 Tax=Achlya hypogyna TaxID=1202772 RepID=A0A1V9YHX3_ACHHY|nr:hypothetical protein ACHHYP_12009 [Achlya hypogyna]